MTEDDNWFWANDDIGVLISPSPRGHPPIKMDTPAVLYLTHEQARSLSLALSMAASLVEPESDSGTALAKDAVAMRPIREGDL